MEVAKTILSQLGGVRLKMMVGAKDFIAHPDGLSFRWPASEPSRGNYCKVILTPMDTYKVEFKHIRGQNVKTVAEFDDVYAEDLVDVFERQTGLYLSL